MDSADSNQPRKQGSSTDIPPPREPGVCAGTGAGRKRQGGGNGRDRPAVWVAYGRLLRLFRRRAGLTQEQLAELVEYSLEQVASIEQGRRPAKAKFTAAAERVLNTGGVLEELQEEVDFAKLPAFFRDFVLIELEAVSRFDYDPLLVPGLLQTEEYARAIFASSTPVLDEATIEDRVDARISRQKLLTKSPLATFSFIIGETVLRNPIGSREAMLRQYERLLTTAKLRNVEIQVVPHATGFHPGLNGPMVTVETADHQRYAYFESQGIGHVVSDPTEVSMFELRYGKLRSQALNVKESAAFIEQLAGEQ
ncbi:helix-turn-helix domain-containing protein [Streptomyces cacaoi]|uniref:Transcriptional regulator n=1 Tax=Streptomyces cacaoi TaxID=1898 RepID=A0A4Y3R4E3_STRCI|nr:helix-turn-helix transcriptional regulator [Streptomyces cacaoi]NNG84255.1 helix-turn-helix domain-containing protein [Streptomyces cacaoi]GEB50800.1 transcriptional regulator [Streptomyces cacaoi]